MWQFGERGYDVSINAGGRVAPKPPRWEYMQDPNRVKLFDTYAKLINLRLSYPATFNNTTFDYDFYDNNGLVKRFQIADPSGTGLKVTVIANFDVVPQTRTVNFQSTGTWYLLLGNGTGTGLNGAAGSTASLATTSQSITLQPGEYHVYLDRQAVLPLKLVSFTAKRATNLIALSWITTNEINVKHFELQRSMNGVDFTSISTVAATNRQGNQAIQYGYNDNEKSALQANANVFYRLKMTDRDGAFTYSAIQAINPLTKNTQITAYPNPVKGSMVYLQLSKPSASPIVIRLEDITGRLYLKYTVNSSDFNYSSIPVNVQKLSSGSYVLKVETGKTTSIKQIIIQH